MSMTLVISRTSQLPSNFQNRNLDNWTQYFGVFNQPGLTSGPGCIMTRLKTSVLLYSNTCVWAFKPGSMRLVLYKKDAFKTIGYTNWKGAAGENSGGFLKHERSEVGFKLSHTCLHVQYLFASYKYILFPVHEHLQSLPASQIALISQVVHLVKLMLLMSATNAVSERIDALH